MIRHWPVSQPSATDGLPASHVLHLADLVKRWGVSERQLFAGLGLRREDLVDSDVNVPVPTIIALVDRARALTREPALGVYIGLQMSVSVHGLLGFAAMCAATLGEALALAVQYAPTRTTALSLHLEVGRRRAAMVVVESADFGSARDVILLGLLVGLWQMGVFLFGPDVDVSETTVHCTLDEPRYYARFNQVAPRVLFGQSANHVAFNASQLDVPVVSADATSFRLAREQCERVLNSVHSRSHFVDRARRLVLRSDGGVRSLDELAAAVNVSSRTLRRRFTEGGVSYSTVLDEERHARALLLLRSPDLSTRDVAKRLGYSGVANFMRAFRRWTGQTPAAFRSKGKLSDIDR
jgi:AraC-like DNA-binding protein